MVTTLTPVTRVVLTMYMCMTILMTRIWSLLVFLRTTSFT